MARGVGRYVKIPTSDGVNRNLRLKLIFLEKFFLIILMRKIPSTFVSSISIELLFFILSTFSQLSKFPLHSLLEISLHQDVFFKQLSEEL